MREFRLEKPGDIAAIHAVVAAAFGRPNEARLVDALRSAGALSLSAVGVLDGEIVAHVAFSPIQIESAAGSTAALALAPVAVLPEQQRRGWGSALIQWSLEEAADAGFGIVVVLGHPEYYPRFGFKPAKPHGVECPFPVPDEAFMLRKLRSGALKDVTGVVRYHAAFLNV